MEDKSHKEIIAEKKEAMREAADALKSFRKEHKLKEGDTPPTKRVGKELDKLVKALDRAKSSLEKSREAKGEKAGKSKSGSPRASKYTYPEGMSEVEKKKYRSKLRREAKGESGEKAPKKEKTGKVKAAAPAATEPTGKKKKKKVKKTSDD